MEFDWDKLSRFSKAKESLTIATMCENNNLTHALLSRLFEPSFELVTLYDQTKVEKIDYGIETEESDLTSWPVVQLNNGKSLAARLLVGADGGNSPVRKFAEVESRGWDYGRHGLVATVSVEETGDRKIAYQRFLPTGPIALLPVCQSYIPTI